VRRFRDEKFLVWRCQGCRSIHAADEVELSHYYASYPTFPPEAEPRMATAFQGLLRRLVEGGLEAGHRILDYGCGSGAFVRFLERAGYAVKGYDAYAEPFRDPTVLETTYDCVVSQDVIEHVPSPRDLLATFHRLVRPGGLVVVGTPDASAIDLSRPDDYVHVLHAPYHRHILASEALRTAATDAGFEVIRFYRTMYGNTLVPGQNPRFGLHYLRSHDDCLDLLTEPIGFSWKLLSPLTPFYAVFGYFFDRHTDVTFTLRALARN
jgi:2-polyprenyl-3-methyl-5-hydroxy-6-metoxy-1,4-benzoquinol methylase